MSPAQRTCSRPYCILRIPHADERDHQDKLVFAPSPQIENLFDPEPYRIALATDLSSFTQVFMYTLLRAREVADVMSHAEHIIYRNMLEADPYKLRANRRTQVRDVRLAIPLIQRHHRFTAPVFRAGEYAEWKAHERFGDIVSVMQWIHSVLQVNEYQTFRHRWPGSAEPHETDPERVEVDYAHYMGEFCEIAEDYILVQARRKEEAEVLFEKRLERARKEMEERED